MNSNTFTQGHVHTACFVQVTTYSKTQISYKWIKNRTLCSANKVAKRNSHSFDLVYLKPLVCSEELKYSHMRSDLPLKSNVKKALRKPNAQTYRSFNSCLLWLLFFSLNWMSNQTTVPWRWTSCSCILAVCRRGSCSSAVECCPALILLYCLFGGRQKKWTKEQAHLLYNRCTWKAKCWALSCVPL